MQRQCQRGVRGNRQAVNGGYHPRGGNRHLAFRDAVSQIVHHDIDRCRDIVEVQQRLAHAHHDHVGDVGVAARFVQPPADQPQLADDLPRRQISVETLLTCRTKAAIQRAACLRRHAQGAAGLLGNKHTFHQAAGTGLQQPFSRAIRGDMFARHRGFPDLAEFRERAAKALADIGHFLEVADPPMVDPLQNLPGMEGLLAKLVEQRFELLPGVPQKIDRAICCKSGHR